MDESFLHHLGWMFSSAAVRSLFSLSLSLSLLPLLSRLCVAVHCSEIIFCNVFDASLPKICHCLLLFVAVFFSPTPLSFLFVRKFSFVSVLEQPSLEAFFVSFFKRSGERTTRVCVVAREEQQQQQGEQGEQCTLSFLCLLCVRSCCCSGANLLRMMSLEASR